MSGGIYWLRAMQMAGFGEIREKGRWQADLGGREPVRYIVMEGQVPEPELPETKAALGRHGINLIPKIARPRKVGFSLGAELVLNLGDEDPLPPLVNNLATPQEVVDDPARPGLKDKVEAVDWYHTIELGNGVVTPGFVDHRAQLPQYHLPESFAGKRCLDVATFDGFWSFEFERRGASEVVGADIQQRTDGDIPNPFRAAIAKHLQATMGEGFRVAHAALDSKVDHRICNVYDLAPERVGLFDFVFVSDLLLHIRDPQLALERIFSVATGDLLVADVFMPGLDHYGERSLTACPGWMPGSYTWWMPGVQTLKQMMLVAGFESIEELGRFRLATLGGDVAKVVLRAKVPAWKQEAALTASAAAEPVKAERARRGGRADRRETKG
jgi:tRNA (mo5U34)-methyltransferase